MKIEKTFRFLVEKYGLNYSYQEFRNCYNGNWVISAYSYHNPSGCFTISLLQQRNELEFYYSRHHSTIREELFELKLREQTICPDLWAKAKKRFLFAYRAQLYLDTLAQAIEANIENTNSFFGILVP